MSKFYAAYVASDALQRASSDAIQSAHDALHASLRDANKAALFALLAEAGTPCFFMTCSMHWRRRAGLTSFPTQLP